ncbi:MAG: stage V sporulation protein AD [Firmicutes bacterium]|nr:stage V sporulation protein AD [Bacillota bacterium]
MKAQKRLGKQTVQMAGDVKIIGNASIVGKKEAEGPLRNDFDTTVDDGYWGEQSWEKAETKFQKETINLAISKAGKSISDINLMFTGDLINQCTCSSFGARELQIPFYGIFGACSTMAESLSLGAIAVDGGFAENVLCGTSSHFASAEKQFRLPLEYGGQRPPTAQWTVTGSGMTVLSNEGEGMFITHLTTGVINDNGIKDANNMGAAMAPAAADTIITHLRDTGRQPEFYDLIATGDLGSFGMSIVRDLTQKNDLSLGQNYNDCGVMIFDTKKQDVHAGGSGCGCSAAVLCGHILKQMQEGNLKNVLFVGTGALLSTTSVQQGETIPAIAHAVAISVSK